MKQNVVAKVILSTVLSLGVALGMAPVVGQAATPSCEIYSGSNQEAQNYTRASAPMTSFLAPAENGQLMRVQWVEDEGKIVIEYYDSEYNKISFKELASELPIFGGFYEYNGYYYICSGDANDAQNEGKEVYRLTKYNKSWQKMGSASLQGANTTIAFRAGSCRMVGIGKYVVVRTAHQMYTSSDGGRHQANVTFEVDTERMEVTDARYTVSYIGTGYVSHSFNQFIQIEDNHIVAVDHGDAYPRSIVLTKYEADASTGQFSSYVDNKDLLIFPGNIGDNFTGASVGGFELSDSHYIVAGNSVVQGESVDGIRNIFIATAKRQSEGIGDTDFKWLTSYSDSDGTTSTPQMVKLSSNSFMVLWSVKDTVYYTLVDGSGNKTGDISSMTGHLSDCKPIFNGGKVKWYNWDNDKITFYEINATTMASDATEIVNGHDFDDQDMTVTNAGIATCRCRRCGTTVKCNVPTSVTVWYKDGGNQGNTASYTGAHKATYDVGELLEIHCVPNEGIADASLPTFNQVEIITSDSKVCTVSKKESFLKNVYDINMIGEGTITLTVRPKYNHKVSVSTTIKVAHDYKETARTEPTCTQEGSVSYVCKCGATKTDKLDKAPHSYKEKITKATPSANGQIEYICSVCDTVGQNVVTIFKPQTIKLSKTAFTYNGKNHKPSVKVYDSNGKIIASKNYKVVYGSERTKVGKVAIKVTFNSDKYSGSKKSSYKINPWGTELTQVVGKSKSIKLTWKKKKTQVSGYEISYSTTSDFRAKVKTVAISKNTITSKTIKNLKAKKKYYVKIRTYKKVSGVTYYSAWSDVKTIKTK